MNLARLENLVLVQNVTDLRLHFRDGTTAQVVVLGMETGDGPQRLRFQRRVQRNPVTEVIDLDEIVSAERDI